MIKISLVGLIKFKMVALWIGSSMIMIKAIKSNSSINKYFKTHSSIEMDIK